MVSKTSSDLETAIRGVSERVERIEVPGELVAARVRGFAEALANEFGGFRAALVTSLNEHVAVLRRLSEELKSIEAVIKTSNERIARAVKLPEDVAEAVRQFTERVSQAAGSIEGLGTHASDLDRRLSEFAELLRQLGSLYRADISGIQRSLSAAVSDVKSNGEAFSTSLIQSATAIRDALKEASSP